MATRINDQVLLCTGEPAVPAVQAPHEDIDGSGCRCLENEVSIFRNKRALVTPVKLRGRF